MTRRYSQILILGKYYNRLFSLAFYTIILLSLWPLEESVTWSGAFCDPARSTTSSSMEAFHLSYFGQMIAKTIIFW
uniref:Uncharacterized protein n=1 Tax=Rhizophora mucronata TaxID=61149 RepID=A0A2P2NJV9_RHIMU